MLFHASPVAGIQVLEPRVSNHGTPLVYLSDCRENVLVYLSNAVEKFCREAGFPPRDSYRKWGSYGFGEDGVLKLDEYWPNATRETYEGVSGYVYAVKGGDDLKPLADIPHAYVSSKPLQVAECEFVPDAYQAMEQAAEEGKLHLSFYGENSEAMLEWIEKSVRQEFEEAKDDPDYREFLKAKFPCIDRT